MSPTTDPSRLYRFMERLMTVGVFSPEDYKDTEGYAWIHAYGHRFFLRGKGISPFDGKACVLGEFFGGIHDGSVFYLDSILLEGDNWPRIAEDA